MILYTYINCHAEPPNITKQKTLQYIVKRIVITYDNSGIEQYKKRDHFCCCSAGSIAAARKAQSASKKKKGPPKKKKAALWCPSVGRSGGPVFPAVSSVGGSFCCLHTITSPPPPPVTLPTQHPTYATIVTASLAQCTAVASKKENVILLKNNASITRPPSGRAPLIPLPRNARDVRRVFCPYFCYWPAAARHDTWVSNRYPRPRTSTLAARPTCATKDVTRWFSRWWCGSIVSTSTPKAAVVLFIQYTYKKRLSCGVAPFSFKSTKEDPIVVVSVMACHLPAWPLVGTTGACLMTSSFTVAAWFLAIAHLGATVAGESVMDLRSFSTSECWLSIPMWNLNVQLRHIAIQKWWQQRPRICSVRSLCVASVALALVFMPGLYSTAYRATFPAFLCGCL